MGRFGGKAVALGLGSLDRSGKMDDPKDRKAGGERTATSTGRTSLGCHPPPSPADPPGDLLYCTLLFGLCLLLDPKIGRRGMKRRSESTEESQEHGDLLIR